MPVTDCSFCGKDHDYGRCPAYNSTCNYCKKKVHWKHCCLKLRGAEFCEEGNFTKDGNSAKEEKKQFTKLRLKKDLRG